MKKKYMIAFPLAVVASMGMTSAAQAHHFTGSRGFGAQVDFSPSSDGGTTIIITVTTPDGTVAVRRTPVPVRFDKPGK